MPITLEKNIVYDDFPLYNADFDDDEMAIFAPFEPWQYVNN